MVLDPPRKEVNALHMVILSFIPIVGIWVAWRIQKFWLILLLELGISIVFSVVIMPLAFFAPDLAWIVGLIVGVGANALLVNHFAEKYNEKISGIPRNSQHNEKITNYVQQDTKKKFLDQETIGTIFIVSAIGVASIITIIIILHFTNLRVWT